MERENTRSPGPVNPDSGLGSDRDEGIQTGGFGNQISGELGRPEATSETPAAEAEIAESQRGEGPPPVLPVASPDADESVPFKRPAA